MDDLLIPTLKARYKQRENQWISKQQTNSRSLKPYSTYKSGFYDGIKKISLTGVLAQKILHL